MTQDAAQLLEKALRLAEKERAELAARLLESLDDVADEDASEAWDEEIRRRIQEIDSGQVKPIPWSEARKQILDLSCDNSNP
jgi:putative addiction module component (TIGR02574 family)